MTKTVIEVDLQEVTNRVTRALIDSTFLNPDMTDAEVSEFKEVMMNAYIMEGMQDRMTDIVARSFAIELVDGVFESKGVR